MHFLPHPGDSSACKKLWLNDLVRCQPLLYGTTKKFLDVFGLASLSDLPKLDEEISSGESFPKLVVPESEAAEGESGEAEPEDEPEDATVEPS